MEAYIVAGFRSAVGKSGRGGFRFYRPDDLGADVVNHLLKAVPDLDPARVEDLICGNAIPEAESGMQMGRMIALRSELPLTTAGVTVNRYCGSGVETIAMAKVSTSGPEAVKLGYLRPTDKMTVNRDYLIQDAKKTVLAMNMEGYASPRPRDDIRAAGEDAFAVMKFGLWAMHEAGYITEHDVTVSTKLGYVLCGGNVHADTLVHEQYLLDLEREVFLSLCGDPKTHARIQHMLSTGKPLRN